VTVGPTEHRAGDLAAALLAQSDALDWQTEARAKAELAADTNTAAAVSRPGDEPAREDQRAWALQLAYQNGYGVIRPSDTGPRQLFAFTGPGGTTVVETHQPRQIVWGPGTAEQADREWRQLARERENQVLIAAYGEKACRKAGIL
jgi:hypothetical protein